MNYKLFRTLMVIICSMAISFVTNASITVSSSKDCSLSPCTVMSGGTISILGSAQLVHWSATVNSGPTGGHDFWLSTSGSDNTADFPVFSGLPNGFSSGDISLPPGNYRIAIRLTAMGEGAYSITFNNSATISISPPSTFTFSSVLVGGPSSSHTFSITKSGDPIAVTISSITSSDATHFPITTPTPFSAPNTFTVAFHPGTTAGTFTSTITINATTTGGTVNSPITAIVTATVNNPVPAVSCGGGGCGTILGTADYTGGGHIDFTKSIHNSGTGTLHINSIVLSVASTEFMVLSGGAAGDISPGGNRTVNIRY